MSLLTSRRAKIQSHSSATLARSIDDAAEKMGVEIGVGVEEHVRKSGINKLTPPHLALLLLFPPFLLLLSSPPSFLSFLPPVPLTLISNIATSITSVLSLVVGMLLAQRSGRAVGREEEGRRGWVRVRTAIREGVRVISLLHPLPPPLPSSSSTSTTATPHPSSSHLPSLSSTPLKKFTPMATPSSEVNGEQTEEDDKAVRLQMLETRAGELSGLLVGFAFALQYHLHHHRPPIHYPPLSDLLPQGYLSSLKRIEGRVRFKETDEWEPDAPPPSEIPPVGEGMELRNRRTNGATVDKSNTSPSKLSAALPSSSSSTTHPPLSPLEPTPKPLLSMPQPVNLPLALLRLMECYIAGMGEVEGGWKAEEKGRMVGVVQGLGKVLGEMEGLGEASPPHPLQIHLSQLLLLYLLAIPAQALPVLGKWAVVVGLVAGWALVGLEGLSADGGEGDGTSPLTKSPLPSQILSESLSLSPLFHAHYLSRLHSRLEKDAQLAGSASGGAMSKEERRRTKEYVRRVGRARVEGWVPDFGRG